MNWHEKEFSRRLEDLSTRDRLKHCVTFVEPGIEWDLHVGLCAFGRDDVQALGQICEDWEVRWQEVEASVIVLGVDVGTNGGIGGMA